MPSPATSRARRSNLAVQPRTRTSSREVFYKYRSLDNWKFLLDILVNQRLYAAPFRSLNDPMEGRYQYRGDLVSRAFEQSIRQSKDYWKICSLSLRPASTLMWSYYGGGHTGVVLGVTIRGGPSQQISRMRYDSEVTIDRRYRRWPARKVALEILSQKQKDWSHENEVRVFSGQPFVDVRVKSVLLGCQMSATDQKLITRLVRATAGRANVRLMRLSDLDAPLDQ